MKVFTAPRTFLLNAFLNIKFKKTTLLLLKILVLSHFFDAYSFNGKAVLFPETYFYNLNNLNQEKSPKHSNFNLTDFQKTVSLNKHKNGIFNQILITSILKTSYCTGGSGTIVFEANGSYNAINRFSVQISNLNGSFGSPTIIGSLTSSTTGTNNVSFKIPLNLPIGNGYRMRIVSSSPVTNSANNGVNIQITTLPVPSVAVSTKIICPGGTANLSATCISGTVKWYDAKENGNLITNLTVSPSVSTNYFVACEDGTNCSSIRGRQIIIVNPPDALVPPFASSCINSDLELAVVTEETNLRYVWSGPRGFSSTLQNPTITNLTSVKEGVYSVRITNADNCIVNGTTSVSIGNVLQNLNVIGDVTVCSGDTIKLSANASNGSGMVYSWSGPGSFTFTGQNLSRPASVTLGNGSSIYQRGLYTVAANNPVTGCTGATSIDVAVGNRPNVPTVLPVGNSCLGVNMPFNLAISGANFQRYSWTGPNNFAVTAVASCYGNNNCDDLNTMIPNFSQANVGVYSLAARYIDENNLSCVVKLSKNIDLKPNPEIRITSNSAVCLGDALFFQSVNNPNVTEINTYSWKGPNNFTSNVQNPRILTNSVAGTGVYTLSVIGVNGCSAVATSSANIVESTPPNVVTTAGVVLSNSITLSALGCNNGTINWYQSSDNQPAMMPVSPVVATSYYSKCNLLGCMSGKSGDVLVSILPPIAISLKTGNWEDKTTWSIARVPLPIDSVIIRPTHYVTINSQAYAKWLSWNGFGNLIFASPSSKLNLFGNPIVDPPLLSSNPVLVVEGFPVTFTASGTGKISWYKNGIDLNIVGSGYTVNQPSGGDIYTTKRTLDGVASKVSNAITVLSIPSPPVLEANSLSVIENISVTFTARGSGVISWYKNGVNLNVSGLNYTVNEPLAGDVYTVKQTVNGVISGASNAIVIQAVKPPLVVVPPVLTANPSTVFENVPVTFTAVGSGLISWYKNGINLNITGSSHSVSQPVRDDVYTTKTIENRITSSVSNAITVLAPPPPLSSNVTITVPNKPPYYFSDGHPPSHYDNNANMPVIFRNQPRYDPINDFVWLTNDKIKIGINLKRGGQLAWASLINATTNLVYNGYDGGFQVTLDAYQRRDGYTQGGEVSGSAHAGMPTSYNVTQGGDYSNNAASLIDYHSVPNGFYVKLRPNHYPLNAKFSETFIEATYTVIGRSVKIDYRYTSFRTDGQWDGGGFDGAGAPACFIVNTLNKYKTFTGSSPWSFLPTQGGNLPIQNMGQTPLGTQSTEYWGMVYDANNPNSGIGVYNATNGGGSTYFTFKQLEVYPGNGPGTEFTSGFTFFQPFIDFNIQDRRNYVKDLTAYLIIGSELEIRSEVYKIAGHENNIPRF